MRVARRANWGIVGLVGLLVIALAAAALRMVYPASYEIWHDEILIQHDAMRMVRDGEWVWLGNPTSIDRELYHSPLTVYLTAVPYVFSDDPAAARLVYGLLGTLAVVGTYLLAARYFGRAAGLLAALALAVNPLAIYWSRFVWNPNAAPVFIVFWMLAGLMGYYEGKRWAQIAHWLLLGAVIQAQTALLVMAPLSLGLAAMHWWHTRGARRETLVTLGVAFMLVALTAAPWLYGLLAIQMGWLAPVETNDLGRSVNRIALPDVQVAVQRVAQLTGTANYHLGTLEKTANPAGWWPDSRLNVLFKLHAVIVVAGSIALGWRGLRRGREGIPGLWIALVVGWPLLYLLYAQQRIFDFYMMPTVFASAAVFGIVFARLWRWQWLSLGLALVLLAGQAWLALALLDRQIMGKDVLSLAGLQAAVAEWESAGGDVVVLEEASDEPAGIRRDWLKLWDILGEQYALRVVTEPHTFPTAPQGQTLVGLASGDTIPALFGAGKITSTFGREFRWLTVMPRDLPDPVYLPAAYARFDSISRVAGVHAANPPQAGTSWSLAVLWEPLTGEHLVLSYSVRLVGADGVTYGQVDGLALEPALWRAGDTVLTRYTMAVADTFDEARDWHLELAFYYLPEIRNVSVVDDAGNPVGQLMRLE